MQSLTIDHEFKKWLMPLRAEEYELLEQSILREGCREALVVWGGVLVDGHNRYSICTKHGVEFKTVHVNFSGREEALDWIIRNQLARRNVTTEQRDYLAGKLYKENKRKLGENQYAAGVGQNVEPKSTSEKIAEQFKVSDRHIQRAEHFADAVDKIATACGDSIKKDILTREIPLAKKDILTISQMPENKQREAIAKIRSGQSSKRVVEEAISSPVRERKEIDLSGLINFPCANPMCKNHIPMKESQYKEMVGVYPRKYRRVSLPYCSQQCCDGHTIWINAGWSENVTSDC